MMQKLMFKTERFILKIIRKFYPISSYDIDVNFMSGDELNKYIYESILAVSPVMIARFGSIELDAAIYHYALSSTRKNRIKWYLRNKISFLHLDDKYGESLIKPLCTNAGFFPENRNLLMAFSELMQNDIKELNCCCFNWGKEDVFSSLFNRSLRIARLEDLEPYDYAVPWSKSLAGKKVLVIHPFEKSIRSQYLLREKIWNNPDVLPEFDLKTIKAVQSIAGEKTPFRDWFEALEHMKAQMDAMDYDVAIIGCGAYGFHLAAHAKRTGHKAIHLGGATQILFGIRGKRWDDLPAVSKFYNENWVYPLPEETPKNNVQVEGGCYW